MNILVDAMTVVSQNRTNFNRAHWFGKATSSRATSRCIRGIALSGKVWSQGLATGGARPLYAISATLLTWA